MIFMGILLFIIFNILFFSLGYVFCLYHLKKNVSTQAQDSKSNNAPLSPKISKDPMIFEFHLVETGEYILNVTGMEGRHLVKENHKKFMVVLKFIYENEKLRPLPKEHQFKLLTFEKKD